ncbi:major histocompatibility complex class I-related gene protein-like [Ornithorhynchus anatinus]|uniref:major histocompatibility complex class I-related gene protein-like n=1 Tax=Ornithorhynchus anatinus TaxID=9258 RepID=UPI0010A8CE51|nr:major histocompatibility complex class I-related gene protein-like [Ornithorhynchus anatinus]
MESQRLGAALALFLLIMATVIWQQALAGLHKGEARFTAVGGEGIPFGLSVVLLVDRKQVASYNNTVQELVVRLSWLYQALGRKLLQEKTEELISYEKDFHWGVENWMRFQNRSGGTHTLQLIVGCELDQDIQVGRVFRFAYDGEDFYWLDEQRGVWISFWSGWQIANLPFWEGSPFWSEVVRRYTKEECASLMKITLQYWNLIESTPPEVTVTRHDGPDGSLTLSCLATGFYPSSILLRWVKDGEEGLWGEESSSGTLPNADDTFYLRQTLQLRAEAGNPSYACLVEHSTLGVPTAFPEMRVNIKKSEVQVTQNYRQIIWNEM